MPVLRCLATPRMVVGLTAVTLWGASPGAAQDGTEGRSGPIWTLEGLRAGQCIRFLMDPQVVGKRLRTGSRSLRADQDPSLHPALRSVVDGQPEFASWIPAALCLFYTDALQAGGRRFSNKDPRKRPLLGLWSVGAVEEGGARRDVVLDLFGSGGGLVRAAERDKVRAKEGRSTVSQSEESGNDLYDIRLGRTRLVWNGKAAGDSTSVADPIEEAALAHGTSGIIWRLHINLRPAWTRPLVGVLTVEGKDDLAKALKASPTRFVGPLYYGGGGDLRFSR